MKICMIAEGCYPYVVGGVSSWLQMMMEGLDEHDFEMYTIAADSSQKGAFKYRFPDNLRVIHENFLINHDRRPVIPAKKTRLPRKQADALSLLIKSEDHIPWKEIYEIVHSHRFHTDAYLNGYDFFDAAKERYERDNVATRFADYLWTLRSMFLPLFSLLEKEIPRADIYHAASAGYAGVLGALGAALHNKAFILSEHGIYTREREEELIRSKWTQGYFKEMWIRHFYTLSQFAYEQADCVVSLFEKNADIQKDLGCVAEKIRIIPNGISVEDFADVDWRKNPDGYIDVGAVIRVTPIKDIKTMLAAFKEVQNKVHNARFHILGPFDEDPDYYKECVSLMEQLGLRDCEMPGRVNIKEYLPGMDILVLTSISEGQPLAILEGMMFHKPWVSTNVGSCRELLDGMAGDQLGSAGFIAPVMDALSIAREIIKLAQNERLRADMGEIGFQRASRYYKKRDMFQSYRELYEQVYSQNDALTTRNMKDMLDEEGGRKWQE